MTFVCVPITVDDIDGSLALAGEAKRRGAELVEFRIDGYFHGSTGDNAEDALLVAQLQRLSAETPVPCIVTCRSAEEGGDYDGDDADRVALLEKLTAASDSPPRYIDIELSAYTRSANLRQKVNLCVEHPKQMRDLHTRLILSIHDFEGRPADLTRRLAQAYDEPAASVVKVAFRARSLRDNLELFEILREAPKPTIALGMGEFGLMSRVLAPKFGGFLTFASLSDTETTAPGQPTIDELLGMYRFRSIGKDTKVYGVIGWPVTQSMGPLIHNAGFTEVGHDGVYLPLPIAADADTRRAGFEDQGRAGLQTDGDPLRHAPRDTSPAGAGEEAAYVSFKATVSALIDDQALSFAGASVTMPHKENLLRLADELDGYPSYESRQSGAANTLDLSLDDPERRGRPDVDNTDVDSAAGLLLHAIPRQGTVKGTTVAVMGAGGLARAITRRLAESGVHVVIFNRTIERAESIVENVNSSLHTHAAEARAAELSSLSEIDVDALVNCTPVGMAGGPDPDGLSIPIPEMTNIDQDTVFFDTVYNPIETPMLKAARERGCRTIDGVQMFVKQAAAQFELWTGKPAPVELFDRLVRERLSK